MTALKEFLRAPLLSPAGLVVRAAALAALYWTLHLSGLRDYATVLSGGLPSPDASPGLASFLGMLYVLLYFGWILVVPVTVLASGILFVLNRGFGSRASGPAS